MKKNLVKKVISLGLICIMGAFALSSCGTKTEEKKDVNKKLSIVTTIYPQYDFAKQIGGDKVDVKMLLKPGAESHSYEPSPQDVKEIQNADLFIYVGGENDDWVNKILKSFGDKKPATLKLTDCVTTVEEEIVEGMEPEEEEHHDEDHHDEDKKDDKHDGKTEEKEDDHDHDVDEHVWTSPGNAIQICDKITEEMCKLDPENADYFKKNNKAYTEKIANLDKEFKEVVDNGKRKTILVGDRFPLRYFVDRYGLKYYAAFSGCSDQTEANASTIAFLIDKAQKEKIPVVFDIELSNGKIADTIAEASGAKKITFYTCHNVSADDIKNGTSYVEMMQRNVDSLKQALN